MIYILFIMLIIIVFISYHIGSKILLSPGFFTAFMYLVGTSVVLIYKDIWEVEISAKTTLLIILFIFSILIGDIYAVVTTKISTKSNKNNRYMSIDPYILIVLILFMALTFFLYYREITFISQSFSNIDNMQILMSVRYARNQLNIGVSLYIVIMSWISEAIFYTSMYIFLNNTLKCKNKILSEIKYLIPVFIFGAISILSTGRTLIMRMFIYTLVIVIIFLYEKYNWNYHINTKIFRISLVVVTLFLVSFYILGFLTGKSNNTDFLDVISIYVGSPIAALNEFFENPIRNTDFLWGGNTLFGFYTIIRRFIDTIPELSAPLEFISFKGGQATNIYTPIRRYYQDFGYLGVIVIAFFIGYFYKLYLLKIKTNSNTISTILYAYAFYPLVEIIIEERIFMDLLTIKSMFIIMGVFMVLQLTKSYDKKIKSI